MSTGFGLSGLYILGVLQLIEVGNIDRSEIKNTLEKILHPLVKEGIDAIALGCTHYAFLSDKIKKIMGQNVAVVDSGGAVARRTRQVLENNNDLASLKNKDLYFTTGDAVKFGSVARELTELEIETVTGVSLS